MLIQLATILATVLVAMITASIVTNVFGLSGFPQLTVEMIALSIGGYALVHFSVMPVGVAVIGVTLALVFGLIGVFSQKRQFKKAQNGDYGDEVKWATELIEDGDNMFLFAMNGIDQTEMKEVGIIAESKEELRELTIERFEEKHGEEELPQEFMQ